MDQRDEALGIQENGRREGLGRKKRGKERGCVVERMWLLHLTESEPGVYLRGLGHSQALVGGQR